MHARLLSQIIFCLLCLIQCLPNTATASQQRYTSPSVYGQYTAIDQTQPFYLVFELDIAPQWHTYWINPGETGSAPKLQWQAPEGYQISETLFLPPKRIQAGPFINYGYENVAYHLVRVTPPTLADSSLTQLDISLKASWLVCKIDCIPERTTLRLTLPIASRNQPSAQKSKIDSLIKQVESAPINIIQGKAHKDNLALTVQIPSTNTVSSAYFFAETPGVINPSAKQSLQYKQNKLVLTLPRGVVALPDKLTGLLMIEQNDAQQYFQVTAETVSFSQASTTPFILVLAFAFIGGLLLNIMPCVFPILAIKALSLSKVSAASKYKQGLLFTAGILVTFTVLATIMLMLRAAGQQVGWGFQMQSPIFVSFLVLLFTLITFNLVGLFEVSIPGRLNNLLASKQGDFASGVLYVLIATPCTAPFMAVALGYTLTTTPLIAMTIFWALGLGLALPFMLLISWRGFIERLPKPGSWLARFKTLLALPISLTVVWLLWVYDQQVGASATAALLCACTFLYFVMWYKHNTHLYKRSLLFVLLVIGFIGSIAVSISAHPPAERSIAIAKSAYTADRLDELRAAGKPVFVYATASWCITCKVNEFNVLNKRTVKDWFKKQDITVLEADWTLFNPEITQFLNRYNRTGVPLYVFYPTEGQPVVLPQLLSIDIVKALQQSNQDD